MGTLLLRRPLLTSALFLFAGASANVGVAWGTACWSADTRESAVPADEALAFISERRMLQPPLMNFDAIARVGFGRTFIEGGAAEDRVSPPVAWVAVLDAGWPLRALRAEWRARGATPESLRASLHLHLGLEIQWMPNPELVGPGLPLALPVRPIVPGFVFNTLFYAGILWVLIYSPFALRRFIRRRRALCPSCGYAVGQSTVCTECGKALRKGSVV